MAFGVYLPPFNVPNGNCLRCLPYGLALVMVINSDPNNTVNQSFLRKVLFCNHHTVTISGMTFCYKKNSCSAI